MISEPYATVSDAVRVLNEALEADREAIEALVLSRSVVNSRLAAHPTIQCGRVIDEDGPLVVGVLGIINGIFGSEIGAEWAADHPATDDDRCRGYVVDGWRMKIRRFFDTTKEAKKT